MENFIKLILDKIITPVITVVGGAVLFRIFIWWRLRRVKDLYTADLKEVIDSYQNFAYALYSNSIKGSVIAPDDMGYKDLSFWYKYSRFLFGLRKKRVLDNTLKLLKEIQDYQEEFKSIKLNRDNFGKFEEMCHKWAHCYYTLINISVFGGNPKFNRHIHMPTVLNELGFPHDEKDARERYMIKHDISYVELEDNPKLMEMLKACSGNNS